MRYFKITIIVLILLTNCNDASDNTGSKSPQSKSNQNDALVFKRINEPKENAFSILIPKGWETDGGIFRVNPISEGPTNAVAAKLDFAVKRDAAGSVMIRWLPDMIYYDSRYSPAGQMGLFPPGSNYQGMLVAYLQSPEDFITQFVIPYAHPNAESFAVTSSKNLSSVARNFTTRTNQIIPYGTFSYDAGVLAVQYSENGIAYEERIVTVIENWGELGTGMWGNKETFLIRAPKGKLTEYEKIFSVIQSSVTLNMQWLQGELRGQAHRGEIVLETQREVQRIGKEITEHRQKTNSEIHNDMYLTLTEQEEYVNPYNNEVEVGSNQWQHRWINESGDVIYTDQEDYDPNIDINLNMSDFKRTPIRKR
jgi:hypothetical protein